MIKSVTTTFVSRAGLTALLTIAIGSLSLSHDEPGLRPHHIDVPANPTAVMRAFTQGKFDDGLPVQNLAATANILCDGISADGYPCNGVDLMSFMPLADIGSTQSNDEANDIWGWTDPMTDKEYAIIGRVFGTSFVDISDPVNPVFLGELDTHGRFGSPWRDIKVYNNHAFIVSEARRHGMQVFDLTQLRNVSNPPVLFSETAHYRGFGSAHNIVINEDSGYAYAVGTDKCSGGLEMVDISNPTNPTDAGCYAADGYTHDAQCVIYNGPDTDYQGKEICFASNEDTLTIVDVTIKSNPVLISRTGYAGSDYTHQGWLTEDQHYFLLDDELDEQGAGHNTRTYIWDVSNLDALVLEGFFENTTAAIDHNQYVHGNCSFQANYRAGLRILEFDPVDPAGTINEIGYFDIYPAGDEAEFNAAWSNYPYFDSGVVIVSGIEQGLFVVKPSMAVMNACGLSDTTNVTPTVTLNTPVDGANVSGVVTVDITASDLEDAAGSLTVEWQIDGGDWNPTTYDSGSYVATWDTTQEVDGGHTITVRATDSGNATANDAHSVITDNGNVTATMHVHSLGGMTSTGRGGKWNVIITVEINDASENDVEGALVTGSWSGGANGSGSCTTGVAGSCNINKNNINRNSASATFTVDSVTHPTLNYEPNDDEVDTSITLTNPN